MARRSKVASMAGRGWAAVSGRRVAVRVAGWPPNKVAAGIVLWCVVATVSVVTETAAAGIAGPSEASMFGRPTEETRQISIDAAIQHACGVKTDHTLACWGIGDGRLPPRGTFVQVTTGYGHSCGLATEGSAICWGWNAWGQATPPGGRFEELSAGDHHTCGLRSNGTVVCWGDNDKGQLRVPSSTFRKISAGSHHTCGIRTDGTVSCWGYNNYGQSAPPDGSFLDIDSGEFHSCGVTTNATAKCWGQSQFGATSVPDGVFIAVAAGSHHNCFLRTNGAVNCRGLMWGWDAGDPPFGQEFLAIAASHTYSCGIQTDGDAICWGQDSDAPVANPPRATFGSSTASSGVSHTCMLKRDSAVDCWGNSTLAVLSPDFANMRDPAGTFIQISAGFNNTCGVRTNGKLACWGANPARAGSPPAGEFVGVSVGGAHACALKPNATPTCWGSDALGQSSPPVKTFLQVSSGFQHTCGIDIEGTAICWGSDWFGQATPPSGEFVQVSAGGDHTCGLMRTGAVACWGDNRAGQASAPPGAFLSVSAGMMHTCGVKLGGNLVCWGRSAEGQTRVPSGSFAQVTAGGTHTCALRVLGGIACWGDSKLNQTGSIGIITSPKPPAKIGPSLFSHKFVVEYSHTFTGAPLPPVTLKGNIPPGLIFRSPTLSGTPTAEGTYRMTTQVGDQVQIGAAQSFTIVVDLTAPVVTRDEGADSCSLPGNAGWCRGTQTAGFAASGPDIGSASPCLPEPGRVCRFTRSTSIEGAAVKVASGLVCDPVGNCGSTSAGPFAIDRTPPYFVISANRPKSTSGTGRSTRSMSPNQCDLSSVCWPTQRVRWISVKDESSGPASFSCTLNKGSLDMVSATLAYASVYVGEGDVELNCSASDVAGNTITQTWDWWQL